MLTHSTKDSDEETEHASLLSRINLCTGEIDLQPPAPFPDDADTETQQPLTEPAAVEADAENSEQNETWENLFTTVRRSIRTHHTLRFNELFWFLYHPFTTLELL